MNIQYVVTNWWKFKDETCFFLISTVAELMNQFESIGSMKGEQIWLTENNIMNYLRWESIFSYIFYLCNIMKQ